MNELGETIQRDSKPTLIGIDLGGTNMNAGVVDPVTLDVLVRASDRTEAREGVPAVVTRLATAVRQVCREARVELADAARASVRVGVAAPGAIDHERGIVREAPNLKWRDVPLRELLAAELEVDARAVTIENDVNAALLGECAAGAGRGLRDVLGVWVGTGVGGAILLNGSLHHGPSGSAGEIGQTVLLPSLKPNVRAARREGIMERQCSRGFIQQRIVDEIQRDRVSMLTGLIQQRGQTLERFDPSLLREAYDNNDGLVVETINQGAWLLGAAIANALTVLGVTNVILGGGLAEAMGNAYAARVADAARAHVFPDLLREALNVRITELHAAAGIVGAASLAAKLGTT